MNLEEVKIKSFALVDSLVGIEERVIALLREIHNLQFGADILQDAIQTAEEEANRNE